MISFHHVGSREPSENLNIEFSVELKKEMKEWDLNRGAYGLFIGSLNVMMGVRRLSMGDISKRTPFLTFSYRCVCHVMALIKKDIVRLLSIRVTFKNAFSIANYCKITHLANHCLVEQRISQSKSLQSLKCFSQTRWNGSSVML